MASKRLMRIAAVCALVGVGLRPDSSVAAEPPTAAQALSLRPIQKLVEYTIPTKEEAAECTNSPEKSGNVTAWVVRNRENEILRRFADTNGDNVVDQWCYYLDGLEVYRDIDANYNGKADQYRWFHTGGTRWGLDKDEVGRIDTWKTISAHEVGEQVVLAIKSRDPARFALLLATPAELNEAGFAKARADKIAETISAAPAAFSKLLEEQKAITQQSRFVDFGSAKPALIPAGTDGSTQDVVIIDNASALVETDGKHEQVSLGTLVEIGDTWKLIAAPTIGAQAEQQPGGLLAQVPNPQNPNAANGAPTEEMQQLMSELEKLDTESASLPDDKQAANIEARAEKLKRLAEISPESDRVQWYRQLADMLSVAAQSGNYPQGLDRLEEIQKTLAEANAGEDAISHTAFQRMWAEYVTNQQAPDADPAKVQGKWLDDLQVFVAKYPKSPDAAEALLQLGMYQEFVGKTEEATKWYQKLVTDFPKAEPTNKAKGALRRLGSVGKPIRLQGTDLAGARVDSASYRRKVVLIHYWATWCEPCKADMVLLKDFYAKKGGREFDIIGVCLDNDAAAAKQFLTQERFTAWKHLHEAGGLDGRLANEMGVMTLPVMILVDQNGNVANNNIHAAELESEFNRLTTPTANAAKPARTAPLPR